MKKIYIYGGGTFTHVRNHLALAAPAFGETANMLSKMVTDAIYRSSHYSQYEVYRRLTKMAWSESSLITNDDVSRSIDEVITDPDTKIIFFNVALCDFVGTVDGAESGKYAPRLQSRTEGQQINIRAADKIIKRIRKTRKDIFLVAFKTTTNATEQEQYIAGLNLLKENSCNLVLANDTVFRRNMIIVPEEAKYCVTTDRQKVLSTLVDMAFKRSELTFTRSIVIDSPSVDWNADIVPDSLRTVVNYCIEQGAYKPFRGNTAGHFAVKVDEKTFLTSKRSTNFNDLEKIGLVEVDAIDDHTVIAHGAKPSVGGQSQRIIFSEHSDVDCIVHFHCPPTNDYYRAAGSIREQYAFECGSHECGKNTSDGLVELWDGIKVVYLDEHGPNIVFKRTIDPNRVIGFIKRFFDLSLKTGGPVAI